LAGYRTFARGFVAELSVCGRDLGDEGVRNLVSALAAAHLTGLVLRKNRTGAAGLQALAACRHLARLTFLDLRDNCFFAEDVRVLAESPYLTEAGRRRRNR
jgi:hypothetical protein